jgi:type I restriction enzyme S subunit
MRNYPEKPLGEALVHTKQNVLVSKSEFYPIAGIYSFGKGLIKRDVIQGDETAYKSLTQLSAGHLVMSKLNAWEGALSVVTRDFDGTYVSPEYPIFEIDRQFADVNYIRHLVSWPKLWVKLTPRGSMVRRKRTTPETLLTTAVPLPDLDEQRRIVDKLDALLGRVGTIRELRTKSESLQTRLAESLIETAVTSTSDAMRVGEIVTLERTSISLELKSSYRVIGVKSFGKGIIHYPPALGDEVSKLNYFKLPADALLLSNIKAWEGAISVTTDAVARDYIASSRFLSYMPRDERVSTSYLRHYFLSRRGLSQVSAASPGGADRNRTLGRSRFEALTIPLPPRAEQDRIARILDSLGERVRERRANPTLDALRTSILNAAFTGQL